jgi:hypothetical protein
MFLCLFVLCLRNGDLFALFMEWDFCVFWEKKEGCMSAKNLGSPLDLGSMFEYRRFKSYHSEFLSNEVVVDRQEFWML